MNNIEYKDIKLLKEKEKNNIKIVNIIFPNTLNKRIINSLYNEQIYSLGALVEKYKQDRKSLKIIPNMGRKCFNTIETLITYAYPEIFKKEKTIFYTFLNESNNND